MGDGSDNIPGSCKGVGEKSINDFIKLLLNFHFSEPNNHFDFSGYPNTIDDMKNRCEILGIKYKKAYLNFNPERFFINLKLVDLRLVDKDITPELIDSIFSILRDCNRQVNYFSLAKGLGDLGIKEVSADELISNVSQRKQNLLRSMFRDIKEKVIAKRMLKSELLVLQERLKEFEKLSSQNEEFRLRFLECYQKFGEIIANDKLQDAYARLRLKDDN